MYFYSVHILLTWIRIHQILWIRSAYNQCGSTSLSTSRGAFRGEGEGGGEDTDFFPSEISVNWKGRFLPFEYAPAYMDLVYYILLKKVEASIGVQARWKQEMAFRLSILLLTYLAYMSYHLSRFDID